MRIMLACAAAMALTVMLPWPVAVASQAGAHQSVEIAATDMSARKRVAKRHRGTGLRVTRLSRRATEPPNPNRPYYRPAPAFFPFATDRGYF